MMSQSEALDDGKGNESDINQDDVIESHGTWAVTTYGVECWTKYYELPASSFCTIEKMEAFIITMSKKEWVNIGDFTEAITRAREIHFSKHG